MIRNKLILIGIIFAYFVFVVLSMNQPFHGDEIVFSESAKAILEKGVPVFDYSQFSPNFQGLWHTPLYVYIMSLFIAIFGQNIYSFRLVSLIFNLGVIILVYLIGKEIFKGNKKKEIFALLAALVYALNPLTIQSSVVLDIDAGLLNFAIYLFLYFYVKEKRWYWLLPSLLFVFLSKESGPVLLFGSILLLKIITKDWKKLRKTILMFFIAGILFLIIFGSYTALFGLNFSMPFKHNFAFLGGENLIRQTSLSSLMSKAWSLKSFVYFAIPSFILLFFWLGLLFYIKILKNKKIENKNILLLNIFSVITIFLFFYLGASGWGFPKYHITALPAMSLFSIYMLNKTFKNFYLDKKKLFSFVLVFIVLLVYFIIFVKDPLMPEFDATSITVDIGRAALLIVKSFVLYFVLPLSISLALFKLLKFKHVLLVSLIFLTLFCYLYLNSLHSLVDYSTYYTYGDTGIKETLNYFEENDIPSNQIATYAHLGSYLGMSEYWEITWKYNQENLFKGDIVENPGITYIVIYHRDIARIGKQLDYFTLQEKIGSYYIFKKK